MYFGFKIFNLDGTLIREQNGYKSPLRCYRSCKYENKLYKFRTKIRFYIVF